MSDIDEFMDIVGTDSKPIYHYYYLGRSLTLMYILYEDRKKNNPPSKWTKVWDPVTGPTTNRKTLARLKKEEIIKIVSHYNEDPHNER